MNDRAIAARPECYCNAPRLNGDTPGRSQNILLSGRMNIAKIFDLVLDGKSVGWMFLRFAMVVTPAVLAIILLSIFFRLD